jgi:hypothetical protein
MSRRRRDCCAFPIGLRLAFRPDTGFSRGSYPAAGRCGGGTKIPLPLFRMRINYAGNLYWVAPQRAGFDLKEKP